MPDFLFSGSRSRRLAVDGDPGAQDDAAAVGEGEGAQDDEGKDELIVLDKGDATLQDLEDGPMEYMDKDLGGVAQGEIRTTHTTKTMNRRAARVRFDSLQWMAFTAAIISILAAAGWQLSERLPQFAKPKPEPMEISPYDPEDPKWQIADLTIEVRRLKDNWDKASEAVKEIFSSRYMHTPPSDATLDVFLRPALALLDAGLPGEAQKGKFAIQIALVKGAVHAANIRISALTKAEEMREKAGLPPLTEGRTPRPTLEELEEQTDDLVSLQDFALMLARHGIPQASQTGIPKVLAHGLAEAVAAFEAESRLIAAFEELRETVHEDDPELANLQLPGEKTPFPTALLLSVLDSHSEARQRLPFPVKALTRCASDCTVKTASEVLASIEEREAQLSPILEAVKAEALQKYHASTEDGQETVLFSAIVRML